MIHSDTLDLRRITQTDYDLRALIGDGRTLELFGPWTVQGAETAHAQPPRLTVVRCRSDADSAVDDEPISIMTSHGRCVLHGARDFLSLLTGVPKPNDSCPSLTQLFDRICIPKIQHLLISLIGPAAIVRSASAGEIEQCMTMIVERGDLSAICFADASVTFWQALLRTSGRSQRSYYPPRRDWLIELPLYLGATRIPVDALATLAMGDIVRFDSPGLRPDGSGNVRIGNSDVQFNFVENPDDCLLSIEAIRPWAEHIFHPQMNADEMTNSDEEEDSFDDLDLPPQDSPTQEEAEVRNQASTKEPTSVDVRTIDIEIIAEVGRLNVALGELSDLCIGSVLKVAAPGVRDVVLRTATTRFSAGRAIASGELVQVGDSLAVEILRVFE